ncbi:uncharacterized protein BO97DRAFT_469976 [Aspergillus homomorphus CBS 101889]|uniref:Glutamine amidotransferase domain-containing protein n=1 Tax=Aspergillus homomorphus (strain CBS 101889) TaxID=1450537 RepID=A0A395HZD2_ASPHC|nr:hypothetical protein BO97DRAFT_469976 [Aspergillus homomorphus CBS 101889]RAL13281.1 hypothetical protein BO97DRAFT_469976 [Aspergillus homomorphus CBS 101889]
MITKKPIHIAILDTDVPVPTIYATRGLYSSQFRHLLQSAAAAADDEHNEYEIHTTAFDVVGGQLPAYSSLYHAATPSTAPSQATSAKNPETNPLAHPITGILITGSAAAAYDPPTTHPWIQPLIRFIRYTHTHYPDVRIFGSCFGHQVIAKALLEELPHVTPQEEDTKPYVKVESAPTGKEVGLKPVILTSAFTAAFPTAFPDRNHPSGNTESAEEREWRWNIQMIHGDHVRIVRALPRGWCVVGASAECAVQGLYQRGRVLTYQGHFEFDAEVNRETCLEFARRQGWKVEDVRRWVAAMEVEGVQDDAKAAAGVVLRSHRIGLNPR